MTLIIVGILLASNVLWLFACARLLERLKSAKRDLEIVGACNDRLRVEVTSSKCHLDSIHAASSGNRWRAYRN